MAKTKHYMATVIMAAGTLTAAAGEADTLSVNLTEHRSMLTELRGQVFSNPAMQSLHYRTSLNTVAATFSHRSSSAPVRHEYGDRSNSGSGLIEAYLHNGKATLWGNAAYSNGKTHGIKYCETSGFDIVAPYVMADTVGGSSRQEYYHFAGGFSWPLGRFNVAAEGEYSALMEYRTRDPRPKNLTGDLRAKAGVSYYVDDTNIIGIALTARKYKQTNEVEFYNEVSVPTVWHLTGLGTDYYRFRGDYTETYYKGWAWGGMMSYSQRGGEGLFAHAGYERMAIDKIISSLNQLPMSTTTSHNVNATLGFSRDNEGSGWGIAAFGNMMRRNGTENIFGTAKDNIYPQIAEARQYRLTKWAAGACATWQRALQRSGCAVALRAYYDSYDEHYAEPERAMKASAIVTQLTLDGHLSTGRMFLSGRLTSGYEWTADHSLTIPAGAGSDAMLVPVTHYYGYLSNNRWDTALKLEAACRTELRVMPFIALNGRYARYSDSEHGLMLNVTAGVRF